MNKFAFLLLFPFAATPALPPRPVAAPAAAQVVLPAAPAGDWSTEACWRARGGRGPAATRPSAIRALARLLRAYAEPARPAAATLVAVGAPLPVFANHYL
ncbi:hypothetical protein [Hymenobacter jeollabukensis]|uniref:Secreted protein n=1 Tax=Hymenobacter jeollabukensis TaxID=2025313 RepID=A0A5R8WNQ4_9BACT|nr:hypothetical protein [Hymenobacter jeollabukensis]TLM91698.1 hypothetical protein FDY95_14135 [Hymenobacter jeollabukensis]